MFILAWLGVLNSYTGTVCNIWEDSKPALIALCDGMVVKSVSPSHLTQLKAALNSNTPVTISFDLKREITRTQIAAFTSKEQFDTQADPVTNPTPIPSPSPIPYEPTLVTYENSLELFKKMNRSSRARSQCYQRAMIWNWETYKNESVKGKKVFLFFTRKYIEEFDYHWWFHVAPVYVVSEENTPNTDYVLDPTFFFYPQVMKDWTDGFIGSKQICPVAEKYSDYSEHQWESHCYLMIVPMYYYQPKDLYNLEQTGATKDSFEESDVGHAYRGFKRRL